jgi:hypothetical protein
VVEPALGSAEPGQKRLLVPCEGHLSYAERHIFPGGCFFVAAPAEAGAQAGRIHDKVARVQQQRHDLPPPKPPPPTSARCPTAPTPAQLAFEPGVILTGTDIVSVLHDDLRAISAPGPPPAPA